MLTVIEGGLSNKMEKLKDVVVPDFYYNRILTGSEYLDKIFGNGDIGGIVKSSVTFITGVPGSGKSTFCLTLSDQLSNENPDINLLYNGCEEPKEAFRLRLDKIGLTGNFLFSNITDVDELISKCRENAVNALVIDSLQKLTVDDFGVKQAPVEAIKRLYAYAKSDDVTVFVIGHVLKDGKFAGSQEILHEVDAYFKLTVENKDDRFISAEKNRFGDTGIKYQFWIAED